MIRTLPGALNRLILPVTLLFEERFVGFTTMGKPALPLSWIHSKIISAATFRIIGLTKIAKIEFLPLDWIYRSIRILMVGQTVIDIFEAAGVDIRSCSTDNVCGWSIL